MLKSKKRYLALLILFLVIASAETVLADQLRRVTDISHVCMVNNEDMGKPQIPIKVGDETYYGCCKMCIGTLNNDRKARFAVDPVSGKEVDKAKAIIGAKSNGAVVYFENEKNFQAFISR
ncbi:MAG: lipoprotein MlpB [Deltaproteobacteria bacterium]|nr:lipoprotein MlpB [Deltaproteobacteria bacterium]